jgi:hypothetical protein
MEIFTASVYELPARRASRKVCRQAIIALSVLIDQACAETCTDRHPGSRD